MQSFFDARLNDICQSCSRKSACVSAPNTRDVNGLAAINKTCHGTTEFFLNYLCFDSRSSQANRNVMCEMSSSNRKNCCVNDSTVYVNDDITCTATHIDNSNAKIFFVLAHACFA